MDPQCNRCALSKDRINIVHGEGSSDAKVMFIGEAPGALEDAKGRPFIGRSGKLLRQVMDEVGLDPSTVYITNVVKCRPPENRTPSSAEIRSCLPNLMEEIYKVDPDLIVFVGRTSACGVTKMNFNMGRDTGSRFKWKDWNCVVIYHPGWIIRALNVRRPILERELKFVASHVKASKQPRGLARWV
jgi:uracil-DNA glycosylase family 4